MDCRDKPGNDDGGRNGRVMDALSVPPNKKARSSAAGPNSEKA